MHKSEKLISKLADNNLLVKDHDKLLAQHIIRELFCEIHNEAVQATIIATNKQKYIEPNYQD